MTFFSETGCKIIVKVQFSEKMEIGERKKEGGSMFGDARKEEEQGILAQKRAK